MDTLDLQQRWQALSAGEGDIGREMIALDQTLSDWLTALHGLNAYGMEVVTAPPSAKAGGRSPECPARRPPCPGAAPEKTESADGRRQPGPPAELSDEELLRSLDPDTANLIRVRRRLMGNQRTIRELLAEHEAARLARQQDGRRRWRRKSDE